MAALVPYAVAAAPYVYNIGKKYSDPALTGIGGLIGSAFGRKKKGKSIGHGIAQGIATAFGYANGGLVVRPRLPMKTGGYRMGGRVVVSGKRPSVRRRF
jgi:hypothetical protein